ncbi:MAG: hypothetical protein NUV35_04700 [Syntrophomonadaceae bacterium]|nr:hypothetical protein [Syntrophomonadaceae bacterium]
MGANWQEEYKRKLTTYEEAAKLVRSGDVVGTALGTGCWRPSSTATRS